MLTPSRFEGIYDIFYTDRYHLIMPVSAGPVPKYVLSVNSSVVPITYTLCPHRHTIVYSTETMPSSMDVKINDVPVTVSRYPSLQDKIIMSTLVKDEDKYIIQWIRYHQSLGVQHFIIYDNSEKPSASMEGLLDEYIRDGTVILIHWPYKYRLPVSGISAQITQQNHSIYAFRQAKYIGLLDIDEYVVALGSIEDVLDGMKMENIGGFQLGSRIFHNSQGLREDGYEFLKITECGDWVLNARQKVFVLPLNVTIFSVHMILLGKPMYRPPPDKIHFNHYMFLNKPGRGRSPLPMHDDSLTSWSPEN